MVIIWYSIHNTLGMTLQQEIYFRQPSIRFQHFVMPDFLLCRVTYVMWLMQNHNLLFITVSFLIILGGIGFPILVNLKETLFYYLRHPN